MRPKSMRDNLDISSYLVVGPENTLGRPVTEIAKAALDAGFTCIQIRSKEASARELLDILRDVANLIYSANKSENVALLVDDRLDVALAAKYLNIKVDGIHVGQSDIPPEICRHYLGNEAIVGLSAPARDLLQFVNSYDSGSIDYLGAGPLHETSTKPDAGQTSDGGKITRSLAELKALAKASKLPVVVGGGVKINDIGTLSKTGVDGFFVVSAVAGAKNPLNAAKELRNAWIKARNEN